MEWPLIALLFFAVAEILKQSERNKELRRENDQLREQLRLKKTQTETLSEECKKLTGRNICLERELKLHGVIDGSQNNDAGGSKQNSATAHR